MEKVFFMKHSSCKFTNSIYQNTKVFTQTYQCQSSTLGLEVHENTEAKSEEKQDLDPDCKKEKEKLILLKNDHLDPRGKPFASFTACF